MTSNERSDISPDNRLFIQQLVQANTNENITAAHHIRVIHMWKENSAQRDSNPEKVSMSWRRHN